MRIVLLSDEFPPESAGGSGFVAHATGRALLRNGHEVSVITTTTHRSRVGMTEVSGIPIDRLYSAYHERWRAWRSLWNPTTVPAVTASLRQIRPDVTHAHNIHYHLSYGALSVAKCWSRLVCLTAHDAMLFHYGKLVEFLKPNRGAIDGRSMYRIASREQIRRFGLWYNPVRNRWIRHVVRNVDQLFAVSTELKRALADNGFTDVDVVHNGVELDMWKMNAACVGKIRERHQLTHRRVILFGGRLSQAKGSRHILQAMPAIIRRVPNAQLVILGRLTPEAREIHVLAKAMGIDSHVTFVGWVSGDERTAVYHASDVVVVPSVYLDPFPLTCQEAMACGKPVVATCLGGAQEVVQDGVSGFIVDPFNTVQLADRIALLLEQPNLREQFGRAGYERIRDSFTIEHHARTMVTRYEQLLARKRLA